MKLELQGLLSKRNEHRILAAMLLLLHAAVWWDFGAALSRSLVLAHLGLFLLWQPLWRREQQIAWRGSLVFVVTMFGIIVGLDWWLMTFWLLLLTGLVGGRESEARSDRVAALAALVLLVSELLVVSVPGAFQVQSLEPTVKAVLGYALLVIPAGLFFVPVHQDSGQRSHGVDFLYGLTVAMLATILALGSLLRHYTGTPYPVALFQTALAIALFLLAISWLWTPLGGFGGLGQIWERYLLNIGTPFEQWLQRLADLGQGRQTPAQFLRAAMEQFVQLPWVAGVTWSSWGTDSHVGKKTSYAFGMHTGEVQGTVYARRPVSTALLIHGRLLTQLIGYFHSAKERERELAQRAHMKAVYDTGARVTHDIKNLLQSLHTMTTALEAHDPSRRVAAQQLLERQLPHLTQRLQLALDKLQAPSESGVSNAPLSEWWQGLQTRNPGGDIQFVSENHADPMIPADLFDSVVDNLLENARIKRQMEPDLRIRVTLHASESEMRIEVCDNGSRIEGEVAQGLLKGPVDSRSGLGIGLFQAAQQADQAGYRLWLQKNFTGRVCFELARKASHEAEAPSPVQAASA